MTSGTVLAGRYRIEADYRISSEMNYYVSCDELFSRRVVIEEFRWEPGNDGIIRDFLDSRRRQILLDGSAGLLKMYAAFCLNDAAYSISEYPCGKSIRELIREHGTFSFEQTKSMVRDLGRGLTSAHRLQICHGGLTPDCCFWTNAGEYRIGGFVDIRGSDETLDGRRQKVFADVRALAVIAVFVLLGSSFRETKSDLEDICQLRPLLPDYAFEAICDVVAEQDGKQPETVQEFLDRFLDEETAEL